MKNCKVTNVYGAVVVVIALLLYNYLCNQCLSPLMLWVQTPLRRGVLNTTLCDTNCQSLSPGTPVSSTNKTDRHNTTEILLKVALNTINPNPCVCCHVYMCVKCTVLPLSVIYLWYFGTVLYSVVFLTFISINGKAIEGIIMDASIIIEREIDLCRDGTTSYLFGH